MEESIFSVIIVAAGNSTRYGGDRSKVFLPLGESTVLEKSVAAFERNPYVGEIIISARSCDTETVEHMISLCGFKKVKCVTQGGATRQESVFSAFGEASPKYKFIAIHDGARPLANDDVINGVFCGAVAHGAAACAVPLKDTVKIIDSDGFVELTPPRETLRAIQTPQAFSRELYEKATQNALLTGNSYTDDCQLVEAVGARVYITEGDYTNLKITTPEDLITAEGLIGGNRND